MGYIQRDRTCLGPAHWRSLDCLMCITITNIKTYLLIFANSVWGKKGITVLCCCVALGKVWKNPQKGRFGLIRRKNIIVEILSGIQEGYLMKV